MGARFASFDSITKVIVIEIVPPRDLCESCYVRTLRTYVRIHRTGDSRLFYTECRKTRSRFEIRFELVIFGICDFHGFDYTTDYYSRFTNL